MRIFVLTIVLSTTLAAQHHEHHDHGEHHEHTETTLKLLELSLNIMTVGGTSTSTNDELRGLQLGSHDPRRRGFTLQQAEFAIAGALDPWFAGKAYLVATEDVIELEEAFVYSLFSSWMEVRAGYYFTEFGRMNRLHPHQWRWLDQPVATGRLLGPEGLRGVGARAAFQAGSHRLIAGVQNPMESQHHHEEEDEHGAEGVGGWPVHERDTQTLGDLLYSARWEAALEWGDWKFEPGVSGAYGPNESGPTGRTWLFGADAALQWSDEDSFFRFEAEYAQRYWQADGALIENDPVDPADDEFLAPTILHDWGAWLEFTASPQAPWVFGLRVELASGFRSGPEARSEDPRRDDRLRISPMASWQPMDELKLTLQYNFDHTEHIGGKTSHGIWLGLRVMFGTHNHAH